MKITGLKVNHLSKPLGFELNKPVLSYRIEDCEGSFQTEAMIQLSLKPDESGVVYETGILKNAYDSETGRVTEGIDSIGWKLDVSLLPRTRYFWRVYAKTDAGEQAFSDWDWFETPKAEGEAWKAQWITSPFEKDVHPVFKGSFEVRGEVESARLYCIGLGMYEASLNGCPVGDEVLMPGFYPYDKCLQYQTYEIVPCKGLNRIEFVMGDGWYKGRYGLKWKVMRYGYAYRLLAEIRVRYTDGTEEVFGTGSDWKAVPGAIQMDSIYDGETVDMNASDPTRACPAPIAEFDGEKILHARSGTRLKIQERRSAVRVPGDKAIYDFGQNMVGWVEIHRALPKGCRLVIRYAETMRDGELYRENLRGAKCTFTYVSDGKEERIRPHFTFFGFRYIEIECDCAISAEELVGCVIHSEMDRIGFIKTSDEWINRLFENIIWSQKGNFLEIPTDCPQRDERMGWTGDIQVFSDAALYNTDCAAFLRKFQRDLALEQKSIDGSVPCVVPMGGYPLAGVTGWGDAAAVIPWQLYLHSGDIGVLEQSFESMRGWVDYITRQTEAQNTAPLWTRSQQLGDWLALDGTDVYGGTDRGMIATAYYYYSAYLTALAAKELGRREEEEAYTRLSGQIRDAFRAEYFTPAGRIACETQTACVMTLYLKLVPENAYERTCELLRKKLYEAGMQLETGFLGTPWLLPILTAIGNADMAYRLLLRREYPGWLNEIAHGATTIWERWNSIEPDGSMNRDQMNSFNHYAYGSVGAWMFRSMCGVAPDERAPGFRVLRVEPHPSRRMAFAEAELMTPLGKAKAAWKWTDKAHATFALEVPFGCRALVRLPGENEELTLTKGRYEWNLEIAPDAPDGLDAGWREALNEPSTRAAVEVNFPHAIRGIPFQYEMQTLRQLTESPFSELTKEEIEALETAVINAQNS